VARSPLPHRVDRIPQQRGAEDRPTEHIAKLELGNAMAALLTTAPLTEDEVYAMTRQVFGGRKVSAAARLRLSAALTETLATGWITREPDGRLQGHTPS